MTNIPNSSRKKREIRRKYWFRTTKSFCKKCAMSSFLFSSTPTIAAIPPPLDDDENSVPKKKITIYLIRHAETEENVKMYGLQEVGNSIYGCRVPSSKDLSSSLSFLGGVVKGDTDSDLSQNGKQQIDELFQIMNNCRKNNDVANSVIESVDIIGHSPLTRAKETCFGVFGLNNNDNDNNNENKKNVVELSCLEEVTPWETAVSGRRNTVHKRIGELKEWIESQKDSTSSIALVGHSEYFMIMLGVSRSEKFQNCDVWKVDYEYGGTWSNLEIKHRLDSSKPMGF
jgi:phosphohistidine phosphatase SixA